MWVDAFDDLSKPVSSAVHAQPRILDIQWLRKIQHSGPCRHISENKRNDKHCMASEYEGTWPRQLEENRGVSAAFGDCNAGSRRVVLKHSSQVRKPAKCRLHSCHWILSWNNEDLTYQWDIVKPRGRVGAMADKLQNLVVVVSGIR